MPGPVSQTSMRKSRPRLRAPTKTPPRATYRTALDTRLRRICSRSKKSLRTHASVGTTRKPKPASFAVPAKVVWTRSNSLATGNSVMFGVSPPASSLEISRSALNSSFIMATAVSMRSTIRRRQETRFSGIGEFELMGPLLDLAFKGRVGIPELRRHAVELFAQCFQFVAGFYADLLVEVAAADARGAVMQRADRYRHATCEIKADER